MMMKAYSTSKVTRGWWTNRCLASWSFVGTLYLCGRDFSVLLLLTTLIIINANQSL